MKTQWINVCCFVLLSSLLTGCYLSKPELPPVVATIGTAGSLGGAHGIRIMSVRDTRGGGAGFGYGAVESYAGKSATIGIGVPKSIEGEWAKSNEGKNTGIAFYYRIFAQIDAELARQKIETLQNYYQNFQHDFGVMDIVVEGPRVQLLYAINCFSWMDCTPKENADPNGWVVLSPAGSDVVVLFDGVGETSTTPFPGSSFDK